MTSSGPAGPGGFAGGRKVWPIVAGLAAIVVLGLVLAVVVSSGEPSPPAPTETAQPSVPSSPLPTPASPSGDGRFEFELFDDFTSSAFDPDKWAGGDNTAPFIYSQGGTAHLEAPVQVNPEGDSASLRARLPRPVTAVRFQMTLLTVDGPNDGAAYLIVSRQASRNHKLIIGPDGQGFPVIGYDICALEAGCRDGEYDDFEHPVADVLVELEQPYDMLVYASDDGWIFEVNGQQQAIAELEQGPIESLGLYLYSFGEGPFHATIDNLFVDYAS